MESLDTKDLQLSIDGQAIFWLNKERD